MKQENKNKKAHDHAVWAGKFIGKIIEVVYEDAMLHGWKHGEENENNNTTSKTKTEE